MSKRVLLFVLASMMMSICIPACARKQQSKSVLAQYFIEIGDIQEEAKARPQGKEDYPQDTNKIPEGITVKELIFSLPSITTNRSGKLITIEGKEIVNSIKFNSQFVLPADSRHRYYKNDTKLKIGHLITDISGQWYSEDTKLNSGTVYVQINKGKKGAYIIIEYYQNVSFDLVGGNSEYVDLGLSVIISGKKPGYKDRSIFLPASGSYLRMDNEFDLFGNRGDYWSSSRSTDNYYRPASGFFIDRFEYKKSVTSRHLPKSIRPVCP